MNSVYEVQIQPCAGAGLSFITPAERETQNVKFDAQDPSDRGLDVPPGSAAAGGRVSDHTLEITDKIEGKVMDTRQIELSADLKTLTMTVRPVSQNKPLFLTGNKSAPAITR